MHKLIDTTSLGELFRLKRSTSPPHRRFTVRPVYQEENIVLLGTPRRYSKVRLTDVLEMSVKLLRWNVQLETHEDDENMFQRREEEMIFLVAVLVLLSFLFVPL